MDAALLVFWAVAGWCGTPWPRRWPPPPPSQWWFVTGIIGIVGGLVGGLLFDLAWPVDEVQDAVGLAVVASGAGALVGSLFLQGILGPFLRPQPEPPG